MKILSFVLGFLLLTQVAFAATFTKYPLSGASNGLGVEVVATSSTGTTIHTAVSGTSSWDEVWLYATNNDTAAHNLTIEYGGTSGYKDIQLSVPAKSGLTLIVPGLILQNGLLITAFADTTNVITIFGYVNRIA